MYSCVHVNQPRQQEMLVAPSLSLSLSSSSLHSLSLSPSVSRSFSLCQQRPSPCNQGGLCPCHRLLLALSLTVTLSATVPKCDSPFLPRSLISCWAALLFSLSLSLCLSLLCLSLSLSLSICPSHPLSFISFSCSSFFSLPFPLSPAP